MPKGKRKTSTRKTENGYILEVITEQPKTQEQIESETQVAERDYYLRWLMKQSKNKSGPMLVMQRRTLNTAAIVRTSVKNIPFNKLSVALYFFCKDMEQTNLARRYESQLELASINPEKFTKGLHRFYNETAMMIQKEGLFPVFAEFISNSILHHNGVKLLEMDEDSMAVEDNYMNLLLQQMEYLRPKKFDLETRVCGLTTTGEIMTCQDHYPTLDEAGEEAYEQARAMYKQGEHADLNVLLRDACKKRGINVSGLDEYELLSKRDRYFSTQLYALVPYINEYSYDMLPGTENVFLFFTPVFQTIRFGEKYQIDELIGMLKRRTRTLPVNGQKFEFKYNEGRSGAFSSGIFKETFHNESIVLLYKIQTSTGEITGFYNTKTELFFSPLCIGEAMAEDEAQRVKRLVLFLYASMVTRQGDEMRANMYSHLQLCIPKDIDEPPDFTDKSYEFAAYGLGGKLKDVYHADAHAYNPTGPRAGNEAYEPEPTAIQGFIRRVAEGKKPSQEAIDRAVQLGFELAPNETYVQPFIRTSWKKKGTSEQDGTELGKK